MEYRIYTKLTGTAYGEDNELIDVDIKEYEAQIKRVLDERIQRLNEKGLAEYLPKNLSVKIKSIYPDIEMENDILKGVCIVTCDELLEYQELEAVMKFWEGQAADGWGEEFEQIDIHVNDLDFNVHFWSQGRFFELIEVRMEDPELEMLLR